MCSYLSKIKIKIYILINKHKFLKYFFVRNLFFYFYNFSIYDKIPYFNILNYLNNLLFYKKSKIKLSIFTIKQFFFNNKYQIISFFFDFFSNEFL